MAVKLALALILAASPAWAECAMKDDAYALLAENYDETRIGGGLHQRPGTGAVVLVEVWASDAGTFTILATSAEGLTCVLTEGTDWRPSVPIIEGDPS